MSEVRKNARTASSPAAALLASVLAGCAPSAGRAPAPVPVTVPASAAPEEPPVAPTEPSGQGGPAGAGASGHDSPVPLSGIPCESVEDCWSDRDGNPVARPRHLRGKTFRPCEDGGGQPRCDEGRCGTMPYGC